ncbi:hypothetical protein LTR37_002942 [Vermiconidia calcicola]|uniref:Uncharacterized protein n=1 Tax=Vermiconidia calcicola TaxID=1690605 RepID=A0ACC3NS05_9PEZI|nr:hypothetical protein LTR37_002942 [Vermiconidia calcicola]
MLATREILRGERILAEQALLTLPPLPADMIHVKHFLSEGVIMNGRETVNTVFNSLPEDTKAVLRGLVHRNRTVLSIVAKNCFTHEKRTEQGILVTVVRVYNEISRINHSCQANAVVAWNERLQQGTVHALKNIPSGAEILVNYTADVTGSLRTGALRRASLEKHYDFGCTCSACRRVATRGRSGPNRDDDDRRRRAKVIYDQLFFEVNVREEQPDEGVEDIRLGQIALLDQYINLLKEIGLHELQVNAFEARAQYHEQGAHLAKLGIAQDADAQGNGPGEYTHTRRALEDWRRKLWTETRLYGQDHPDTQETARIVTDCESLLARLPSPQTPFGFP